MNVFVVNLNRHLRAACAHIDVEGGDAVGGHEGCVVFLEEQQVTFLQMVQVMQRGFDFTHGDLQFQLRIAHRVCKGFAPFAV